MIFAFSGEPQGKLKGLAEGLERVLQAHGHRPGDPQAPDVKLVFHFADPERPRHFRRRKRATFVVTVVEGAPADAQLSPQQILQKAYPLLVQTLANLVLYAVPTDEEPGWLVHFITLELGCYRAPTEDLWEGLHEQIAPLAQAQLVIDNVFVPDLPPALWDGTPAVQRLREAGRRLAKLNLLPAPFPLEKYLSPKLLRHIKKLYGIGGLSYGNLSVRHDARSFWMSASGVDKGNLGPVGRDILLVRGYDPERRAMIVSVPPQVEPRRVSVDAIEHWMVYEQHPKVGAIVHVHAWMEGVPSTRINYPCGTLELARAVADLVAQAPDPTRAVVGLKNHGLTITGPDFDDIFRRIEGKLLRQVPMSP